MPDESNSLTRLDYQLTLDHVEKLLDRRQGTTTFFISANAAIAAAIGLLLKDSALAQDWLWIAVLLLEITGFFACLIWFSLLRQYERLLGWWYARLWELEAEIPGSPKLVTREYQEFYKDEKTRKGLRKIFKPVGMTERERLLAGAIAVLYLVFAITALVTVLQ
jgi:hypothetical protein